ncbi:hypothetical protein QQM79_14870 [Marinobacteraceae bacterium S3BR75-40.1]
MKRPAYSEFFTLAIHNVRVSRHSLHFCGDVTATVCINGAREQFIEFLETEGLCRDQHSAWNVGLNDELKRLIHQQLPPAMAPTARLEIENSVRADLLEQLTSLL